jgi:hypothetical protein
MSIKREEASKLISYWLRNTTFKESDPKYPGTTVFKSLTDFFNNQLINDQNDWYNI